MVVRIDHFRKSGERIPSSFLHAENELKCNKMREKPTVERKFHHPFLNRSYLFGWEAKQPFIGLFARSRRSPLRRTSSDRSLTTLVQQHRRPIKIIPTSLKLARSSGCCCRALDVSTNIHSSGTTGQIWQRQAEDARAI